MVELHELYPQQFPLRASRSVFSLPQDVNLVSDSHLREMVLQANNPWLVVAGWECQDLSSAGSGKGLAGPRSGTFYELHRILESLQAALGASRLGYLVENTAMQHNWKHPEPRRDYALVCFILGESVLVDAAQFGSGAHRVRNFWTNLMRVPALDKALASWWTPREGVAARCLKPGVTPQVALRGDSFPRAIINI